MLNTLFCTTLCIYISVYGPSVFAQFYCTYILFDIVYVNPCKSQLALSSQFPEVN